MELSPNEPSPNRANSGASSDALASRATTMIGLCIFLGLAASLRAIDRGAAAFRGPVHIVYLLILVAVAYAVFGFGVPPVITVYFPSLILLASAHILGTRAAIFWSVPSVALVAAAAFLPVAEPREVDATVTFLVRAGVMLTILAFAVSFRRSHDWQSAELERLATTDALTGLSNRIEFDRALEQALGQAARFGRRGALIFVDLDGMKAINDGIGHGAGDAFLHEIASRIRRITRDVDTPARLGGDEFVVLLTEFDDPKGAGIYARKLLASLRAVWTFDGQEIEPGASIGIAGFPEDASTAGEVLRCADAAMYEAKRAGGNQIFEHAPEGPRGIA